MTITPSDDEVICPQCCHQFRAIPVNVQAELAAISGQIKAPVEVAGIVEELRKDAGDYRRECVDPTAHYTAKLEDDAAAALESLAAQLAERDAQIERQSKLITSQGIRLMEAEDAEAQLAERDAELAALKGHAEAIARCRIKANGYTDWSKEALDEAFAAYRAAYPKE